MENPNFNHEEFNVEDSETVNESNDNSKNDDPVVDSEDGEKDQAVVDVENDKEQKINKVKVVQPQDPTPDSSEENKTIEQSKFPSEDGCHGFNDYLLTKDMKELLEFLPNDVANELREASGYDNLIRKHNSILSFSSNPPLAENSNCETMTGLAPITSDQLFLNNYSYCVGFLENPNPNNWHCEELTQPNKDLNKAYCNRMQDYKKAMQCAPKSSVNFDYKIDDNTCKGKKIDGGMNKEIQNQKNKLLQYSNNSELDCFGEVRSKCVDLSTSLEDASNYVSCAVVDHSDSNLTCYGWKKPVDDDDVECFLDNQPLARGNKEGCGDRYRCFVK